MLLQLRSLHADGGTVCEGNVPPERLTQPLDDAPPTHAERAFRQIDEYPRADNQFTGGDQVLIRRAGFYGKLVDESDPRP